MRIKKSILVDELDLPSSALEDKMVDVARWSIIHVIIFEYEGKTYQTSYSKGATECQDESPWEFDDEVECTEVHKVERVIELWEPV